MNKAKTVNAKPEKAKIGMGIAIFLVMFLGFQISGARKASAQSPSDGRFGTLSGRVIGPDGEVIPKVRVHVFQEPASREYLTETDCSGYYVLSGIEAGNYTVQFAGTGFRLETRNRIRIESSTATKLDAQMQAGELKGERVSLEVFSGRILVEGWITGTVSDPSGAAIPGAQIMAIHEMTGYMKKTTTDRSGHYELIMPFLGRYGVWAIEHGFKTEIIKAVPVTMETKAVIDIRLKVEGGSSAEVTPDPLPADTRHEQPVESGGEIYGKVLDANGVVPARITSTELATRKRYVTTTDSSGAYQLAHLPAGNYCTKFEASGPRYGALVPEFETSREVHVGSTGSAELNVTLPAIPETVVACTATCVVNVARIGMPPGTRADFAAHIYAAHNVIEPGQELWVDISLKNISGHDQFIRMENGKIATADYQISLEQQCGCPGPLLKQNFTVDFSKSVTKPNGWSELRIKRGETFTEKIDLSKLAKLDRPEKYIAYVEYLRDLNDERKNDGKQWPIESNTIVVEVMAASR